MLFRAHFTKNCAPFHKIIKTNAETTHETVILHQQKKQRPTAMDGHHVITKISTSSTTTATHCMLLTYMRCTSSFSLLQEKERQIHDDTDSN